MFVYAFFFACASALLEFPALGFVAKLHKKTTCSCLFNANAYRGEDLVFNTSVRLISISTTRVGLIAFEGEVISPESHSEPVRSSPEEDATFASFLVSVALSTGQLDPDNTLGMFCQLMAAFAQSEIIVMFQEQPLPSVHDTPSTACTAVTRYGYHQLSPSVIIKESSHVYTNGFNDTFKKPEVEYEREIHTEYMAQEEAIRQCPDPFRFPMMGTLCRVRMLFPEKSAGKDFPSTTGLVAAYLDDFLNTYYEHMGDQPPFVESLGETMAHAARAFINGVSDISVSSVLVFVYCLVNPCTYLYGIIYLTVTVPMVFHQIMFIYRDNIQLLVTPFGNCVEYAAMILFYGAGSMVVLYFLWRVVKFVMYYVFYCWWIRRNIVRRPVGFRRLDHKDVDGEHHRRLDYHADVVASAKYLVTP